MNCRDAERQLSYGMDSPLSASTEQALELHLAGCPACARFSEQLRSVTRDAASLRQIEPSQPLAGRAVAAWAHSPAHFAWSPAKFAAGAAVITIAAVALTSALYTHSVYPHAPLSRKHVTANESIASVRQPAASGEDRAAAKTHLAAASWQAPGPKGTSRLSGGVEQTAASASARPVDDLTYLNPDPAESTARWNAMARRELNGVERLLASIRRTGDDFVTVPYPPIASTGTDAERAAIAAYQKEAEVVDARLARKVTLQLKGVSFEALCRQLKGELGIEFTAGRNVADDKMTVFCREKPVRDLMRQIARVFSFSWRRIGEPGAYAYELTQDLKSQLLEEELRNRDKNEALLALDKEMEKLRDLAKLSPDELRERAKGADGDDKKQLENLARYWGAAQLYYNLSPDEMSALRSGQDLQYSSAPGYGAQPLPDNLKAGIFQSMGDIRIDAANGGLSMGPADRVPNGKPPAEVPGAFAQAGLSLDRSELGETRLQGMSGVGLNLGNAACRMNHADPLGVGISPSVQNPRNATVNVKLAVSPEMRKLVTIAPKPSAQLVPDHVYPAPRPDSSTEPIGPMATSADVLEAFHLATGMDVIGDFFTRLYPPDQVSARNMTVFAAVSRICDTMRVKWNRDEGWLQLRSAGYFHDRLKEVPNRLLERWAAKRKETGTLGPEELIEIASLNDVQLNSTLIAQGARALYGLNEWELARNGNLRSNWRFLASTPASFRKAILSEKGASLSTLPPVAQQRFIATVIADRGAEQIRLEDIPQTTLKVTIDPSAMNGNPPADNNEHQKSAIEFQYSHPTPDGGNWTWKIGPFSSNTNTNGGNTAARDLRKR